MFGLCGCVCECVVCYPKTQPETLIWDGYARQAGNATARKEKEEKNHTSIQSIRTTAAHNLDDHRDSHLGTKPNGNGISQGREVLGWWGIK